LNLQAKPVLMDSLDNERIYDQVEKALTAHHGYQRDREYVIAEGKVAIVDEGTGRVMDGRQWQEGLHQAVEAKERVEVTPITASAARISIQTLFRQYPYLAGMSGTALPARRELSRAFKLHVRRIPTNRPCLRRGLPPRIFSTQAARRTAVAAEVRRLQEQGRAILIGTPSVDASEALSRELTAAGIEHAVLNATHHASEAAIVAEAGRARAVTIATNMAGRGTDIHLEDTARAAGGLHVIATEMHSSARIDRQLVGRSARQGDPGSFQFLLSLEDELLHVMEPRQLRTVQSRARPDERGELGASWLKLFQMVQRRCEVTQARQRTDMLRHERERMKRTRQAGLDAFLETAE
jgi:preprotein translocase subunit SecA